MSSPSSFDPLASASRLIVYVDFKSPYAYLAKAPTFQLADDLGIDVDWRPLTLDIHSYLGSARLNASGAVSESRRTPEQWHRVRYAYRDARRYANLVGLTVRGTTKIWDSSLASIGLQWAKGQGAGPLRAFIDLTYERFWKRELDIEDASVVAGVLAEAGAEPDGFIDFARGEGRAEHDVMQQRIFAAGIFGVPSYVLDGELYFGREHLPRIRWMLTGRPGPCQDVAYRHFDVEETSSG
jgi:2-hydroxychromene-2-carboxylate isomerase